VPRRYYKCLINKISTLGGCRHIISKNTPYASENNILAYF
jgi:hypothetical protein